MPKTAHTLMSEILRISGSSRESADSAIGYSKQIIQLYFILFFQRSD